MFIRFYSLFVEKIEKVVECVKQESKVRDTLFLFGAYSIGSVMMIHHNSQINLHYYP